MASRPPGLKSTQWLVLLKDTALVSLIGVDDLMRKRIWLIPIHISLLLGGCCRFRCSRLLCFVQLRIAELNRRLRCDFVRSWVLHNVSQTISKRDRQHVDSQRVYYSQSYHLLICFLFSLISYFFTFNGKHKWIKSAVNLYLTLFTGFPLLVQFFLIYAGRMLIWMDYWQPVLVCLIQCVVLCRIGFPH